MKIKPLPASKLKEQTLIVMKYEGQDVLLLVEKLIRENGLTYAVCRSAIGSVLLRVPDNKVLDSVV